MRVGDLLPSLVLERVIAPTDQVSQLVEELEEELSAHYPPEQRHGLSIEAIFQPHIRFFLARLDGQAVGCGGVALFRDFGELKRMYVRQDRRGIGIADALLNRLEEECAAAGLSVLRLETGTQQAAALRFYEKRGFSPCAVFEPYASMVPEKISSSVFLEKGLS